MIKKYILLVLCALMMASCEFRHIMSKEEYESLNKAILDFDIDWSALDEKPTGATLVFYPCDDNPVDSTIQIFHSNKTDHIQVKLPDQDYSVICFNQSETEFAALKFDLSSFENAYVQIKSDEEMGNVNTKFDWTRGFNAKTSIMPRSFASSSLSSVKTLTRGFNAKTSIMPRSSIKNLSLSVSVFGINRAVLIKSKLKNLASGKTLGTNTLLKETVDQEISTDSWNIDFSNDDQTASILNTSFGTFGIDPARYTTKTRADGALDGEPVLLSFDFNMPDGSQYHVEIDVTDQLLRQMEDYNDYEEINEYRIVIGEKNDPEGTNSGKDDHMTDHGSIVLHKTFEGMNVGVQDWGEPIIKEIKL